MKLQYSSRQRSIDIYRIWRVLAIGRQAGIFFSEVSILVLSPHPGLFSRNEIESLHHTLSDDS